jgi:ubiquinone/menaquinone biosynthesis C-methylase UbiE
MAETTISFDNAAPYERFMGRWSRAVGTIFLEWLAPPKAARWLDVGCGTGSFTELVLDICSPGEIVAVDPAAAQIEYARHQPIAQRADFRVADAVALPFPDISFDIVASALVINFIPEREKALAEMRRVARPGGTVTSYVWDFTNGLSPNSPLQRTLRKVAGDQPVPPGVASSKMEAMHSLFAAAGFADIATTVIDVKLTYLDFDDFWDAQTPSFAPTTKAIAALSDKERVRFRESARAALPPSPDGSITYSARANAIKGRVPQG